MFASTLRTAAFIMSAIVLLSWALFAIDQTKTASTDTAAELSTPTTVVTPAQPAPAAEHGLRARIDDVNDALTSPFQSVVSSKNEWVERSIPMLLALLLYGFGLGYLSRFATGRA